ncbi:MAG: M14 family zinc carboxypeptidase, partial [Actinomycetota bacterium]|nr:M14 family zinc carboxypeptidase [Actinomycetota bacterium]
MAVEARMTTACRPFRQTVIAPSSVTEQTRTPARMVGPATGPAMTDRNALLHRHLPELLELELILRRGDGWLRSEILHEVTWPGLPPEVPSLPVHGITLGSADDNAPAIGFFGGVHGVERVGAQIVLSFLRTTVERLRWDPLFREQLSRVRLVFLPMANPGGIWRR